MFRRSLAVSAFAVVLFAGAREVHSQSDDPQRTSVVRIHVTSQNPDLGRPWTKQAPTRKGGSGVVLDGARILTNAHVVSYATEILVESESFKRKVPASVVATAPGIDLALLSIDDEAFVAAHTPARMNDALPQVRDTVLVYGYPIGGETLSITRGVVSRVDYAGYYYESNGIRIQIDAAVNPGNSGGPAFIDEAMVGLVFSRIQEAENIGYLIPIEEIRAFQRDIEDGAYDGKPRLPCRYQSLENEGLRRKLHVPDGTSGMVIHPLAPGDPECPLEKWDVITRVGDSELDDQGYVRLEDGHRVSFQALIDRAGIGGTVSMGIWRDGAANAAEIPVTRPRKRLMPYLAGRSPSYFVYGPLVFSVVTQEFAGAFEDQRWSASLSHSRSPLLERRWDEPAFEGEQLVVVTMPGFPHAIARGYDIRAPSVVRSVNGNDVRNLRHAVELIASAGEGFVIIEFHELSAEPLVFARDEILAATDEIMQENAIHSQMSADLRDLWPGQ